MTAETEQNPNKELIKALYVLKIGDVEKIACKKWKNGMHDLILTLKDKLFEKRVMGVFEKYGIPLQDQILYPQFTPPKEKFKDFQSIVAYPEKPIPNLHKKIINDLRTKLRGKITMTLKHTLAKTKRKITEIVKEKAENKEVEKKRV